MPRMPLPPVLPARPMMPPHAPRPVSQCQRLLCRPTPASVERAARRATNNLRRRGCGREGGIDGRRAEEGSFSPYSLPIFSLFPAFSTFRPFSSFFPIPSICSLFPPSFFHIPFFFFPSSVFPIPPNVPFLLPFPPSSLLLSTQKQGSKRLAFDSLFVLCLSRGKGGERRIRIRKGLSNPLWSYISLFILPEFMFTFR